MAHKFDNQATFNNTTRMQKFNSPIPLSLYIHLPWCVQKCPYCDFNSHALRDTLPEELYIDALIKDFEAQLPAVWGRRLISIFFGGGTPSLFSGFAIERILTEINSRLRFGPDIEITLEANPGTIDEKRFMDFRAAGVNRLSIGIQSLQDEKLTALGRIHNRDYALRAIEKAQKAGFDNFNLDLMHGLPDQTLADATRDLCDALEFVPPHLSWYQLTIEPNTLFAHAPPVLPAEDILWDIQEHGKNILEKNLLQQYEVSAYSKPGHECQHNVNYWEFGDYLGIGAGSHSKITDMGQQQITRHSQVKNPKAYMDKNQQQLSTQQILTPDECVFEFMLNALRLTKGVNINLFAERTGLSLSVLEPVLTEAKARGLLIADPERLGTTDLGMRFLNDVVELFLKKGE
jgi:putative oxygen-independent coproporphyrinogen III oxidase